MGHLCSCHRAQRSSGWSAGKYRSQDNLLARPYDKRNGYSAIARTSGRQATLPSCMRATSPIMTSSPTSTSASEALANPLGDYHWEDSEDSIHELDESGFSSREPSTLGDVTAQSISAPSTPLARGTMRKKPPPKPPRMRGYASTSTMGKDSTIKAPPSIVTNGTDTLKSSIADVTNTLDNSFLKTPDIFKGKSAHVPATPKEKVQGVLSQAKEFLAYEIEPEEILHIMRERMVVDSQAELEIRKCTTRSTMSEMLIDAVTSKGHRAFVIFCESLRSTKKQGYIVDLLETLDSLVELITGLNGKEAFLGTAPRKNKLPIATVEQDDLSYDKICADCATNNNFSIDDVFDDGAAFDIELLYMDTNTGQTKPVKDVAILKRRKRPRSMGGPEESWFNKDEADRYSPCLSLSVYNQCLITGGGIDVLCNLLEKYSCIRDLSIVKNHIGTKGTVRLGQALAKNRGLIELDIRLNSIGDDGAEHLAQGIRRHHTLKVLNVTSTGLSGHGCSLLIQGKNQTLADVDIGFNDLEEENGCKSIAEALACNCGVRRLRMRATGLHQDGATKILKALKRNSRLAFLDISGNKVGNESMSMLGEVLLCNRTVKEINLENCYISQEGCTFLARALRTNTTLRSLDLSMNPLKDEGIQALSEGLKYNQVLDTLCLNMCGIGNQGFVKLLESLRFNTTMTTLKLCYNNIGQNDPKSNPTTPTQANTHRSFLELPVPSVDELYEKLCQILQINKDLKVLLWGNKFEDSQYEDSKVFFHESDMT